MEDSRGLYYYPNPALTAVRVYVRRAEDGSMEFRMWEKHGWIGMETVNIARELFAGEHDDGWHPEMIYDAAVAEALLKEKAKK